MIHSAAFASGLLSSFFVKSVFDEEQMMPFGGVLGHCCRGGSVIYLDGTLGMGKTTLSRALIQGLGWTDRVKSPTYTLYEQYDLPDVQVCHFDLYRMSDPEELEFLGIRDLDSQRSIWLIEWPEKGDGYLPPADIRLTLAPGPEDHNRTLSLEGQTVRGQQQVQSVAEQLRGWA